MANISSTGGSGQPAINFDDLPSGASLDFATLAGVLGAFALIATAMVLGGSPGAFLDIPALLIVLGGSFLVTSVSFSVGEIFRAQGVMLKAVVYQTQDPSAAAEQILVLAGQARRHGILSLQRTLHRLEDHPFLFRSLRLAVDGLPAEQIEQVLSSEAQAMNSRHLRSAGVLRRAGEVAPAMGLIGTLIGLVQMLGNLEDPESIGPAMAVALLTTFYGAVLANMVFLPLASKLERNSGVEALVNQIFAMGVVSIARQENPRRLEILLNTVLPPDLRVGDFD